MEQDRESLLKSDLPNYVLSISGGKDSTAMLIEMLNRGIPIHSAVWFDTGWEFPEMYAHINRLEEYTGVKIWRIQPHFPFDYWLYARPVVARTGPMKGEVYKLGYGWPSFGRRWCTRQKIDAINRFTKPIANAVQCIGYALDERKRTLSAVMKSKAVRFPLIEFGITEKKALEICYSHGFTWEGLYKVFDRVSCFCCPLGGLTDFRRLRNHYSHLWLKTLEMDAHIKNNRGFYNRFTAHEVEHRLCKEDKRKLRGLEVRSVSTKFLVHPIALPSNGVLQHKFNQVVLP